MAEDKLLQLYWTFPSSLYKESIYFLQHPSKKKKILNTLKKNLRAGEINSFEYISLVSVRIRECGPQSQPLVWRPKALERSNGPFISFVCICVSLYPILDAGRVRFSESPVRFTRKRIKRCVKGERLYTSLFFTRLSSKPWFYRVWELHYGLGRW